MHPILVDFGTHVLPLLGTTHLFLPTYGFLFALGVVAGWWWFLRRATRLGVDPDRAFNLTFYTLLGGLLGAKVSLLIVDWRYYLERPREILSTFRSAGVLMGGILVGAAVFVLYALRQRLPLHRLGDAIAAPLAVSQAVGRIGCFSAGCCWGVPARGVFGALTFTDPLAHERTGVPLGIPLFPTQLVEMAADLLLASVLTVLYRRKVRPEGSTFLWYVLLYSLIRGVIEIWRGDEQRGVYFGGVLSTSQILAVLAGLWALGMLVYYRFRREEPAGS
ncbi:MAG: prolipoprotein diacylglyceryl transferase [Acidobacteriia bacterium]|nr:prolipoprotein diacylglyceryl transferase [Terriglobia bacterium]